MPFIHARTILPTAPAPHFRREDAPPPSRPRARAAHLSFVLDELEDAVHAADAADVSDPVSDD